MSAVHYDLIRDIASATPMGHVNNGMVEVYAPEYTRMRFHTDQALDLAPDSSIAIFSCYEDPMEPFPRVLEVRHKISGATERLAMRHNSVIVFSTATNAEHVHRIVGGERSPTSRWLGITLRRSKTFVTFQDGGVPYLAPGIPLRLASAEEARRLFYCKGHENRHVAYEYPSIEYALCLQTLV
jgi:hypothetical protein